MPGLVIISSQSPSCLILRIRTSSRRGTRFPQAGTTTSRRALAGGFGGML